MRAHNCFGTGDKRDNGCIVLFALLSRQVSSPADLDTEGGRIQGPWRFIFLPSSPLYISFCPEVIKAVWTTLDCLPYSLLDTDWKLEEEGNPSQKAYFSPGATCSPGFLVDFSA